MPENIRSKSLIQPSSIPLTLKRHGRPPKKVEALINTMADHLARQTEEIYFAIIGQIPRAPLRGTEESTPSGNHLWEGPLELREANLQTLWEGSPGGIQ